MEEAAAGWVLLLNFTTVFTSHITKPLLLKEWDYRRISSLIKREKTKQTENTKLSCKDAGKEPECSTQPDKGLETKRNAECVQYLLFQITDSFVKPSSFLCAVPCCRAAPAAWISADQAPEPLPGASLEAQAGRSGAVPSG